MEDKAIKEIKFTVKLNNRTGFHARAVGCLIKAITPFSSKVYLLHNDEEIEAHNILDIVSLALGYQSEVSFKVVGEDAIACSQAIKILVEDKFGE